MSEADRPNEAATGLSALASVFRRCRNRPRTTRSKTAPCPDVDLGRAEAEPDDGRMHLGRRPKRSGRKAQDPFDIGQQLDLDRHRAVVGAARGGQQPVGDLALQHQRRVAKQAPVLGAVEKAKQDRRGDVVGKVADDADRGSLALDQVAARSTSRKSA